MSKTLVLYSALSDLPSGDGFCWFDFAFKLSIALSCSYNAYEENVLACLRWNDRNTHIECLHQHSVRYTEFVSFEEPMYYNEFNNHHVAGYVTVAEDHKLIIVAFRGTYGRHQLWIQIWNTRFYRAPFEGGGLVMDYVVQAYKALESHVNINIFLLSFPSK